MSSSIPYILQPGDSDGHRERNYDEAHPIPSAAPSGKSKGILPECSAPGHQPGFVCPHRPHADQQGHRRRPIQPIEEALELGGVEQHLGHREPGSGLDLLVKAVELPAGVVGDGVDGHPDVEAISNDEIVNGKRIVPGETFHTDHSNHPRPPKATTR